MKKLKFIREAIVLEFANRQENNKQYSKCAFSRDVGVNLTTLVEFMNGKRAVSNEDFLKIKDFLLALEPMRCSWCGKKRAEVAALIAGTNDIKVCSDCIETCNSILRRNKQLVKKLA